MDALKRLKAAKQITAADAGDAGKALQWFESIFGKGKPTNPNANLEEEAQTIRWENPKEGIRAELTLEPDMRGTPMMYALVSLATEDDRTEIFSFDVTAKNFS